MTGTSDQKMRLKIDCQDPTCCLIICSAYCCNPANVLKSNDVFCCTFPRNHSKMHPIIWQM